MSIDGNRYSKIIEFIFMHRYKSGNEKVVFERDDLIHAASQLGIAIPKNIGDIIYSYRYRSELPESIRKYAPKGMEWIIRPFGDAKYIFSLTKLPLILPNALLTETKILDATPGIIMKYALNDEQALLAKLRYNRLIDIFTGVVCYSLQSHLRTKVPGMGQVETDEIYVGVDKRGSQYVFPVQAKAGKDRLGIIQIEQDFQLCFVKFEHLICRPIAAQFMESNLIALFAFEESEKGVMISDEKHYRLISPDQLTEEDLANYRQRVIDA